MSILDPVQVAALDFARGKPGVGWFLEQGLGKSLTALAEFIQYEMDRTVDRMLIICPNTFKQGWVDEIEKHDLDLDVHVFQSTKRALASKFVSSKHTKPPVLIVNYEAVRIPRVLKGLMAWVHRGPTYLAIDESIQIKGHKSTQTKAVHALAPLCAYQRLLTGRPQTQGPHDLWGQLKAIGLFPDRNFFAFRNNFCEMGGWQGKQVIRARNSQALANIMAPVVFQAKKEHWLPKLPRKADTIRDYQMSAEQLAQYTQMEKEFILEIETGVITVQVAIAKYAKLAQIQCGFVYDEGGSTHQLVAPEKNPRLNLLLDLIENETSGKVCIVYRHKAMFDILYLYSGFNCPAYIKGGMTPEETSKQKDRFNEDPDCRVILLQAEASRYGHTLLGGPGEDDRCRTMIFFENSYSADTRAQIEDRIHRRGQTGDNVLYIDLSGSPLDRRIVRALQRKDSMYKSVFGNLKVAEPA